MRKTRRIRRPQGHMTPAAFGISGRTGRPRRPNRSAARSPHACHRIHLQSPTLGEEPRHSKLHPPPAEEEEENEVDGEEPGGGTFKVAGELYERKCDSRERRRAVLWSVKQTFPLFLSIFTTPPPQRDRPRPRPLSASVSIVSVMRFRVFY